MFDNDTSWVRGENSNSIEMPSVNKFSIENFEDFDLFNSNPNNNLTDIYNDDPNTREWVEQILDHPLEIDQQNYENYENYFIHENLNGLDKNSGFVSPVRSPPQAKNQLVSISALGSQKFQTIFKFSHFNRMQSACFSDVFKGNQNVVLSAPTGAGKTGIMELAILRLVSIVGVSNTKGTFQ